MSAEDTGREAAQQKEASYEKPAPHTILRVSNLGSLSEIQKKPIFITSIQHSIGDHSQGKLGKKNKKNIQIRMGTVKSPLFTNTVLRLEILKGTHTQGERIRNKFGVGAGEMAQ